MASVTPLHIIVPVKWVPDSQLERRFTDANLLERDGGILAELDEYPLEAALQIKEAAEDREVLVSAVSVGAPGATAALKKALQIGADDAYLLTDEALAGADIWSTALALSAAVDRLRAADGDAQPGTEHLVLTGMTSDDGESGAVPAQLAERLRVPLISYASSLELSGETLRLSRTSGTEQQRLSAPLSAVVSVTDQANTPRYPNFKAIMAAKKKPLTQWSLAEVELAPEAVSPRTSITTAEPRPPRTAGEIVTDDGEAGIRIVDFLAKERLL